VDRNDRLTLRTAEGIELDVTLAGIGSRGVAAVIDAALAAVLLLIVGQALMTFGDMGAAGFALLAFMISVGYPILFEAFASGRTPGKAAMGIAVVTVDATPIGFVEALIRGVVRPIDMLPGLYLVGIVSVLATPRAQRLGDLAASTIVVHRATERSRRRNEDRLHAGRGMVLEPVRSPEIVGWDVTAVDSELIAMSRAFLERRDQLEPRHRQELATTIASQLLPVIAGVPLDGGAERVIERVVAAKSSR